MLISMRIDLHIIFQWCELYDSYSTVTWQRLLRLVNLWLLMRHYILWDTKHFFSIIQISHTKTGFFGNIWWCSFSIHMQKCTKCCQTIIWRQSFYINATIDFVNYLVTHTKNQVYLTGQNTSTHCLDTSTESAIPVSLLWVHFKKKEMEFGRKFLTKKIMQFSAKHATSKKESKICAFCHKQWTQNQNKKNNFYNLTKDGTGIVDQLNDHFSTQ